jgi:hypothetical protein
MDNLTLEQWQALSPKGAAERIAKTLGLDNKRRQLLELVIQMSREDEKKKERAKHEIHRDVHQDR